ncbi:MAG: OmpA family protein [Thiomicrospira sp.]|jgi:OOP family OmpA-OmpF porin|nr:OmpA family protein [Thiomicrospira sp.]
MKLKLSIVMLAGASLLSTLPAQAREEIKHEGNRAYVWDTQGHVVRDRFDRCVRSIHWTKETAIAKCEGWPEPVVAAAPAPAPAPVVKPAPAPAAVVAPVPAPVKDVTKPVHFTEHFATNKSEFNPAKLAQIEAELKDYVEYLQANPTKKVVISGHTDNRGTRKLNQALSTARANTVKAYLISKGISADRIEAKGYAFDQPVADNKTAEGRAKNRRVELDIED